MILLKVFLVVIIVVLAIYDVLYREIPVILVVIGIFGSSIIRLTMMPRIEVSNIYEIYAVAPALLYIVIHLISKKSIGLGDGLVLLMSELSMDLVSSFNAFIIITISTFFYAIILLVLKHRNIKIPFVVFISLGHIYSLLKDYL